MPRVGTPRHLVERVDLPEIQLRRSGAQEPAYTASRHHHNCPVLRLLLDGEPAPGTHYRDQTRDRNRKTDVLGQQPRGTPCFEPAVSYVRVPPPVHQNRVTTHPDPGFRVVLRVHRVHAAGADHHVIDVRSPVTDGYRVQNSPLRTQRRELLCDRLLAVGAEAPGSLFGSRIDQSGEQMTDQPLGLAFRDSTPAGLCPCGDIGEIVPPDPVTHRPGGRGRDRFGPSRP